jgi:hypothetical protein
MILVGISYDEIKPFYPGEFFWPELGVAARGNYPCPGFNSSSDNLS